MSSNNQLGVIDDLNDAIVRSRNALILCPPGHPDRSTSLINLAGYLFSRYNELGGIGDLNEAIILGRDALSLRPPGHPDCSISFSNVACHLASRYEQLGGIYDVNEAIFLSREAHTLRPTVYPERSRSLWDLAFFHFVRFANLARAEDREELLDSMLSWSMYPKQSLTLTWKLQKDGSMRPKYSTIPQPLLRMKQLFGYWLNIWPLFLITSSSRCSQYPLIIACSGCIFSLSSQPISH